MNKAVARNVNVALTIARALNSEYRHAAIALYKNKVVGVGVNSKRTNWLQRIYAKKVGREGVFHEHAEFAAMRDVEKADTLIVTRVTHNGMAAASKPCKVCRPMIEDAGIKHLYYTNEFGEIVHERLV